MKETLIKICGLKREADIRYVNELKPDMIGFVFLKGRERYVTPEHAAHLRRLLDDSIPAVGVFVNEPAENVIALLQTGVIQYAQLHGQEDEAYIRTLQDYCSQPLIKAFVVQTREDVERAKQFPADFLLLDNGLGTGKTFDWTLLKDIERPFFLAGGLTPENVKEALQKVKPYGVDTSTGVETDGCKDHDKIKRFIEAVREG